MCILLAEIIVWLFLICYIFIHLQDAHAQPPSESTDDEDTSDEAYGRRHEVVLQGMRDKWQRLQQLKNDALYGPGER